MDSFFDQGQGLGNKWGLDAFISKKALDRRLCCFCGFRSGDKGLKLFQSGRNPPGVTH